ncbi:hypothetical protein FKW77_002819 [Venturia effusa]|uniref:Uncharacterized protein n=1 Tax=Venturia effusa TaxID=50376 RepID=A0A517L0Z6_9PEZI|nr:hypothetical protein FKW77_002819 [Venturia effusa]
MTSAQKIKAMWKDENITELVTQLRAQQKSLSDIQRALNDHSMLLQRVARGTLSLRSSRPRLSVPRSIFSWEPTDLVENVTDDLSFISIAEEEFDFDDAVVNSEITHQSKFIEEDLIDLSDHGTTTETNLNLEAILQDLRLVEEVSEPRLEGICQADLANAAPIDELMVDDEYSDKSQPLDTRYHSVGDAPSDITTSFWAGSDTTFGVQTMNSDNDDIESTPSLIQQDENVAKKPEEDMALVVDEPWELEETSSSSTKVSSTICSSLRLKTTIPLLSPQTTAHVTSTSLSHMSTSSSSICQSSSTSTETKTETESLDNTENEVIRSKKTAKLRSILNYAYTKQAASDLKATLMPHRQPPPPIQGQVNDALQISAHAVPNQGAFLKMLDEGSLVSSWLSVEANTTWFSSLSGLADTFSTIIHFLHLFNSYISTYGDLGALETSENIFKELSELMVSINQLRGARREGRIFAYKRDEKISRLRTDARLLLEKLEALIPTEWIIGFVSRHGHMLDDSYSRLMLKRA